jgi:hypothetical protein
MLPWPPRMLLIATQIAVLMVLSREITASGTLLQIGGYSMTIFEFIVLALVLAIVANFTRLIESTGPYLIAVGVMTTILLFNFIRGLMIDPFAAIVSVRAIGPIAGFMLLAPLIGKYPEATRRLRLTFVVATVILGMLALIRRSTGLLQTTYTSFDGRPIGSWGGLLMAVGCILIMSSLIRGPRRGRSVALLCISYAGLVVTGQGTANICGLVGMAFVIASEAGTARALRQPLAAIILLMIGAVWLSAPQYLSPQAIGSAVSDDAGAYVGDREHTNMTRQYIWLGLWNDYQHWSSTDQLLGLPAGVKPVVLMPLWNGVLWQNSMHSMYLQTLVQQGMIGLAIYLILILSLLPIAIVRALGNFGDFRYPISPAAAAGILLAIALFGYSYDLGGEMAPLLMLGFGSTLQRKLDGRRSPPIVDLAAASAIPDRS